MPDRTIRVVIVDDELLARQRIEDLLAKEPRIEIAAEARDGNEAVELIRDLQPDLVFLDVQMPGRTGIEVAETIGAEYGADAFARVPFFILILKPSRSSSNSLSSCSRTISRMRLISSNSMRMCEARWHVCEHFDSV